MCIGNNLVDMARKFQAVVNVDTKIFDMFKQSYGKSPAVARVSLAPDTGNATA